LPPKVQLYFCCHPRLYAPGEGFFCTIGEGGWGGCGGLRLVLPPRQAQGGGAQAQLKFPPKTPGSAQQCIYIDKSRFKSLYFGQIGTSQSSAWQTKAPFVLIVAFHPTGRGSLVPKSSKQRLGHSTFPEGLPRHFPQPKWNPLSIGTTSHAVYLPSLRRD
jgi:hypothetical protein